MMNEDIPHFVIILLTFATSIQIRKERQDLSILEFLYSTFYIKSLPQKFLVGYTLISQSFYCFLLKFGINYS